MKNVLFFQRDGFGSFPRIGTTSFGARNLGRRSVGYEINSNFIPTIKDKLNVGQSDIAGTKIAGLA
jgi:DNA modification methylase